MIHSSNGLDARLSQAEVHHVYNRIAWIYDVWGSLTESCARERATALADIHNGERVLEVAVGTGLMMAEVVRKNPNGLNAGIDLSEGMLQKAQSRLSQVIVPVELKQGSAFAIPYPAASFDLLINGYMFDLLPFADFPRILAEFMRVLKPQGRLVLMNMTEGDRPGSRLYQWIYSKAPALMGGCRGVKLADHLEKAGFRVLVREYVQQSLFPSEVILAKVN